MAWHGGCAALTLDERFPLSVARASPGRDAMRICTSGSRHTWRRTERLRVWLLPIRRASALGLPGEPCSGLGIVRYAVGLMLAGWLAACLPSCLPAWLAGQYTISMDGHDTLPSQPFVWVVRGETYNFVDKLRALRGLMCESWMDMLHFCSTFSAAMFLCNGFN